MTALMMALQERRKYESLRDIARATGISASTINRLENNIGEADADTIGRLASYLEVSLSSGVLRSMEPTLVAIKRVINADKTLDIRGKRALIDLMLAAYGECSAHTEAI